MSSPNPFKIIACLILALAVHTSVYPVTRICIASGLWTTSSNWSPAGSPGTNDSAIIPSGKSLFIPSATTAKCAWLQISGSLKVRGTLSVKGLFEVNGTLDADSSTVICNGTSAQEIRGTSPIELWNLTNSNSSTLKVTENISVKNFLTLSSASVLLIAPGKSITLVSTSETQTAQVPAVPSNASISGDLVQQRYLGFPGWHAVGFTMGGASYAAYDETVHGDLNAGYFTGPISAGQGGFIHTIASGQVVSSRGALTQGVFSTFLSCSGTDLLNDGWNLIANPYPCSIDIESSSFSLGGTTRTIYVWDARNSRYLWWRKGFGGTYSRLISSGQAFWLQAVTSGDYFKISESAKTTGATYYRSSLSDAEPLITVEMASQNGTAVTYVKLGNYLDLFDPEEDSQYLPSSTTSLSEVYTKSTDNFKLVFNETDLVDSVAIPIYIKPHDTAMHTLKFTGIESLPSGFKWKVIYNPTGLSIDLLNTMQQSGQTPTISFYPTSTSEINYFTLVITKESQPLTVVQELKNVQLGKLVQVYDIFGNPVSQDSELPAGIYIFRYLSDSGKETLVKKIISK